MHKRVFWLTYLLENDSLSVRSASKGIGLPSCSKMSLFVVKIGPDVLTTVLDVFAGGTDSTRFTHDDKKVENEQKINSCSLDNAPGKGRKEGSVTQNCKYPSQIGGER